MIQAELQEEQQQIEDLEHQRTEYLNRAERIAERLTTLKAEHKQHIAETTLTDIVNNCCKWGYKETIERAKECLRTLQDK